MAKLQTMHVPDEGVVVTPAQAQIGMDNFGGGIFDNFLGLEKSRTAPAPPPNITVKAPKTTQAPAVAQTQVSDTTLLYMQELDS